MCCLRLPWSRRRSVYERLYPGLNVAGPSDHNAAGRRASSALYIVELMVYAIARWFILVKKGTEGQDTTWTACRLRACRTAGDKPSASFAARRSGVRDIWACARSSSHLHSFLSSSLVAARHAGHPRHREGPSSRPETCRGCLRSPPATLALRFPTPQGLDMHCCYLWSLCACHARGGPRRTRSPERGASERAGSPT